MNYEKPRILPKPEKLRPYPFCGGKAAIRHMYVAAEPSHSRVECTSCHIKTDFYVYEYGERNVIKVWNRRVDA